MTESYFTPVPDYLVEKYDLITAALWGRVWRYCQMSNGICSASQETLAAELGISVKTVERRLKILERGRYIKDLSPKVKNRPHIYQDTGKIIIPIGASQSPSGASQSRSGTSESRSHYVTESLESDSLRTGGSKPIKNHRGSPKKPTGKYSMERWN